MNKNVVSDSDGKNDMPKSPQPEVKITKQVATDLLLFAQANKEMLMPTEAESIEALQQAIRSASISKE